MINKVDKIPFKKSITSNTYANKELNQSSNETLHNIPYRTKSNVLLTPNDQYLVRSASKKQLNSNNTNSKDIESGFSLTLSPEALAKYEEQKNIGKSLADNILNKSKNESTNTKKTEEAPIDKLITQIKEKIEEVNEKLKAIDNDNSEAAKQQRKLLEAQLIALNGILITLIEKKMESIKKSK